LASYVRDRDVGTLVPIETMQVLYALGASLKLSNSQPSPPTIIGRLSNSEASVAALVRIPGQFNTLTMSSRSEMRYGTSSL
jgi:nuclear pore complex protein Nup188